MASVATTTLALKLSDKATAPLQKAMNKIDMSTRQVSSSLQRLKTIAVAAFAGWGVYKVIEKTKEVVLAAARYETLGVAMRVVGNNAGYANLQMSEFQEGLEKTGISMSGARQALTRMAQAQLDLTKSMQLARVAQDTAVIGAINSTEAFNQLVYGIQSANVRVLRTIGINVIFKDSYKKIADQLGITVDSFSEAEKASIRLNAVLKAGKQIAGTYEAAMETAGKQLFSLERHFDNLKTLAGAAFTPALLEIVQSITGEVKDLNKELSGEGAARVHEWGVGFRIALIGIKIELMGLALLLDKIGGSMTAVMVDLEERRKIASMNLIELTKYMFSSEEEKEALLVSRKRTEWMKKNLEYEKRYWQTVIDIVELEEKQLELKYALTDAGKADAKVKADALESQRLATNAMAKALESQRLAEEQISTKVKEANKELEEYYKKLAKSQDAMNQAVLAAMPEYERGIESIIREYAEWNKAIDKNAEKAGYSAEQVARLHKDLGIRMAEDIAGYVESHAETTEQIDELWTNALDRIQSTFADTFMDVMKGELDDFEDVFKAFCDSILRYFAEMAAAMTMKDLFNVGGSSQQGWGGFLSGIFGGTSGGQRGGNVGGVTADIAQIANSTYSLSQAYGAYGTAGGGWSGIKAALGSFFGVGGATTSGGMTAVGGMTFAESLAASNAGYTSATAAAGFEAAAPTVGAEIGASLCAYLGYAGIGYAIGNVVGGWMIDKEGYNTHPEYATYGGVAGGLAGGVVGGAATGAKAGSWGGYIGAAIGAILGGIVGAFLGGNKKRDYLTEDYTYGYGLDTGWGVTDKERTREKRGGKQFAKASEQMSDYVADILNSVEELTLGFLGVVDEQLVNKFKTSMMGLGELGFRFNISAEDKGEFEDDMEKSFSSALDGVINPVVGVASDFMRQATEEAFTSPEIEKVFGILNDDVSGFLRDDMARVSEIFDAPLPNTQKEFEAYIEALTDNMGEVGAILDYFAAITDITDEVEKAFAHTALSQSLMEINGRFFELGGLLMSLGIDLEKYTDFTRAWGIALAEATYGFSPDKIVNMLTEIMDAPSAMEAAETFTIGFMEQIRAGMVNSILSAFTEMMYAQLLAPLAETFLEGAETPKELAEAARNYIAAMSELMTDSDFIGSLGSFASAMWEIGQSIPDMDEIGGTLAEDIESAGDFFADNVEPIAEDLEVAGGLLTESARTAGDVLIAAAHAFDDITVDVVVTVNGPGEVKGFQHGGVVTSPTYALIGEAGYPEVVIPLGGGHKLTAHIEGAGGALDVGGLVNAVQFMTNHIVGAGKNFADTVTKSGSEWDNPFIDDIEDWIAAMAGGRTGDELEAYEDAWRDMFAAGGEALEEWFMTWSTSLTATSTSMLKIQNVMYKHRLFLIKAGGENSSAFMDSFIAGLGDRADMPHWQDIIANIEKLFAAFDISPDDMNYAEWERATLDVLAGFDAWSKATDSLDLDQYLMETLGLTKEELDVFLMGWTDLGGFLEEEFEKIFEQVKSRVEAALEGFEDIIASAGMSDLEKSIHDLAQTYADFFADLKLIGEYLDESGELSEAAKAGLEAFNIEFAKLIENFMQPIYDVIETADMTDYEKSLHAINSHYDDLIAQLKDAHLWYSRIIGGGVVLSDEALALLEALKIEIEQLIASIVDALMLDYDTIIDTKGMSDYEKSLRVLNAGYNEQWQQLSDMGQLYDENNQLTEIATKLLEAWGIELNELAVEFAKQNLIAALQKEIDEYEEAQAALQKTYDDAKNAYVSALQDEIDIKEDAIGVIKDTVRSFDDLLESISKYRDELLSSEDAFLPDERYKIAEEQFAEAVQGLYSGDQETIQKSLENIPGLGRDFLAASLAANTSFDTYMSDVARVLATLNTAESIGEVQKSIAEQTLDFLKTELHGLKQELDDIQGIKENTQTLIELQASYNEAKLALDNSIYPDLIEAHQAMLDELMGIGAGILSVADALAAYQAAMENLLKPDPEPVPITPVPLPPIYDPGPQKWGFAEGGMISGASSGYTVPTTFHGTEHIIPGDQMGEVKKVLKEVKGVLVELRDTNGDQNKTSKKLYRIIDRVSQGEEYLMTKAV